MHCVADTWGAELHPNLLVHGPVVRKGTSGEDGYSGFSVRDPVTGAAAPTQLQSLLDPSIQRLVDRRAGRRLLRQGDGPRRRPPRLRRRGAAGPDQVRRARGGRRGPGRRGDAVRRGDRRVSGVPSDAADLSSGGRMPLLGFGTWQIKGAAATEAVGHALAAGYRHLDTATIYGNEKEVGAGLGRERGAPGRRVRHHEVPAAQRRARARHAAYQPRPARHRPRRPLADPLAGRLAARTSRCGAPSPRRSSRGSPAPSA